MTPDELGNMEPREFLNKMLGNNDLETERRLWQAYVQAINNPYLKEKPGSFKQFCDKMTGEKIRNIKMTPEKFLKIIGAE
jgi:hypothetical protein